MKQNLLETYHNYQTLVKNLFQKPEGLAQQYYLPFINISVTLLLSSTLMKLNEAAKSHSTLRILLPKIGN